MGQRKETICPDCKGKKMLDLGKGDWLKCPTCGGTGTFVCYEERSTPPTIFILGGK